VASLKDYSLSARWGLAFAICFIAPFCEEVIFRFLLNASYAPGLCQAAEYRGDISRVCAYAHNTMRQPPLSGCLRFLLCVVRMASGGLLLPMLLHMLNNAASFSLSTMS
jgi:hypothetical protein